MIDNNFPSNLMGLSIGVDVPFQIDFYPWDAQVDGKLTSVGDCAARGSVERLLPYLRRSHPDLLTPGTMVSQWLVDSMDAGIFGQLRGTHFYMHLPNPTHDSRERRIAVAIFSNENKFARFLFKNYSVAQSTTPYSLVTNAIQECMAAVFQCSSTKETDKI